MPHCGGPRAEVEEPLSSEKRLMREETRVLFARACMRAHPGRVEGGGKAESLL